MKTIILLVFTILVASCSLKQKDENGGIQASEIKGYWEGEQRLIVVWDSIMLHPIKRTSGFHTYTITNDKLAIDNDSSTVITAKLLKLNSDSLVFEQDNEIFRYSRAKPVSTVLKFRKIDFNTGPCEGNCPVFDLRVDENGEVTYSGKMYSEKSGIYYGQLPQQLVGELNELLSYIDFQKASENLLPPPADNQKSELRIWFKNHQVVQVKNGTGESKYNALLNVLYNLGDIVELKSKTP
ncbi:DUF6438 domain-containing protein [Pontibacter sp. E15-1]|uniref:DUF6438 domain-containing protein n=1 Tax=Pontibacter sp. E15-1 TaxID=2919918 RepID=UPI001F5017D1|nr:DUF6438 domain-containing protein [Pontibacter sp. E15-1]MCJ8165529.1 DUF6438 domain-containing protein [Pontibacter sp. E15-1]